MAPDAPAFERGNAYNHIRDALRDGFQGVDQLQGGPIWPYHTVGMSAAGGWQHGVAGVHSWLVRLQDVLGKLAYTQGTSPEMVRRRMLESFFVGAEVDGRLRDRTLPQLQLPPEELAARQAYQQAESAALGTLRDVELRYVRGEVTSETLRSELMARAAAAMATYEEAWKVETDRVGAWTGEP
jgi:hypothetical protein